MEAIRKKVKRSGRYLTIEIPDSFKADEIEVILLPAESEIESQDDREKWMENAMTFYNQFHFDIKNLDWNRDELYDQG